MKPRQHDHHIPRGWAAWARALAEAIAQMEADRDPGPNGRPDAASSLRRRLERALGGALTAAEVAEIQLHTALADLLSSAARGASIAAPRARLPEGLRHSALLTRAALEIAGRDFRRRHPQANPALHLHEHLLALKNRAARARQGVYYTPPAVASFVVRGVDALLREDLGLAGGLADPAPGARFRGGSSAPALPETADPAAPLVRILDPAAGTGAFLLAVIDQIHQSLHRQWQAQGLAKDARLARWRGYVRRCLLPRLHGWEIVPAACAVARAQIARRLRETGCRVRAEDVIHVRVRDALAADLDADAGPFTVIVGNPPYAARSRHPPARTLGWLSDYRSGLDEANLNALSDDYVRFLALAHQRIRRAGAGVIGLVTNNSFLEGVSLRRLREVLLGDFDHIRIVNLHGSVMRRHELSPEIRDENVFDIQQGVALTLLSRRPRPPEPGSRAVPARVEYAEFTGPRAAKLRALGDADSSSRWSALAPGSPYFRFGPARGAWHDEYERWWSLADIFEVFSSGIKFRRESLLIKPHFQPERVECMLADVAALSDAELMHKYRFRETAGWRLAELRPFFARHEPDDVLAVLYRPFDVRYAFYPLSWVRRLIPRGDARVNLVRHLHPRTAGAGGNLGLLFNRQVVGRHVSHVFVTRHPASHGTLYLGNRGQDYVAPLYRCDQPERRPNVQADFLRHWRAAGGARRPERIFAYIYALLHSPTYRSRYDSQLRAGFPRVPLPVSPALSGELARLGARLIRLHLLEASPGARACRLAGAGDEPVTIERPFPQYRNGCVHLSAGAGATGLRRIDRTRLPSGGARVQGVPEEVWLMEVGGYQVARKWLNDRRGQSLSRHDLRTYRQILEALRATAALTRHIDQVIEGHGGWPGAFSR